MSFELNQDICLRCYLKAPWAKRSEENSRAQFFHDWLNFGVTRCAYTGVNESSPPDTVFFEYTPIDEIPKHCPYALEHVVSKEEAHAE